MTLKKIGWLIITSRKNNNKFVEKEDFKEVITTVTEKLDDGEKRFKAIDRKLFRIEFGMEHLLQKEGIKLPEI